jgi:serine/threonine-protein kinase RsbW
MCHISISRDSHPEVYVTINDIEDVLFQLPRTPRSAGRARALLRTQLSAWSVHGEPAATAELLLSELIANAVRHSGAPRGRDIGVRFARYGRTLRVEVADAGERLPVPRTAAADDEGGRGLALVGALAERWGHCPRRHGIGKAVWAEVGIG